MFGHTMPHEKISNLVVTYLTVFGEGFQDLVDEKDVVFVDVETEESQSAGRRAANDVEQDEGFRDQVVVGLAALITEEVLQVPVVVLAQQLQEPQDGFHHGHLGRQLVLLQPLLQLVHLVAAAEATEAAGK